MAAHRSLHPLLHSALRNYITVDQSIDTSQQASGTVTVNDNLLNCYNKVWSASDRGSETFTTPLTVRGMITEDPNLKCSKALHSFTVRSSIISNPSKREQQQCTSNPSPEGRDAETQLQMNVKRSESAKKKRIVCFTRKLLVTPVIDIPIHEVQLIQTCIYQAWAL